MKYIDFKNSLENISQIDLKGLEAQLLLAPESRKETLAKPKINEYTKKAGVLALFYPNANGEVHFLLTLRASYKGTHSAQISFPGGKYENNDGHLSKTATRECFEEVGVLEKEITIFKEMTDVYIPPSNFLVSPFLGYTATKPTFKKNHEVSELIEIPLKTFLEDTPISYTEMDFPTSKKNKIPYFKLKNYIVWGATAMILSEIKELLNSL